jgi:hypothetical protein
MPDGYTFVPQPNDVAMAVLSQSTWAVLAFILDLELFTQLHYRESIDPDPQLSDLFKDVFRFHWKEESQHAIMDELEWKRHDATVTPEQRDQGVDQLIELVGAVDGILQAQAQADADYGAATCGRTLSEAEQQALHAGVLKAYRWQYILSGVQHPHFVKVLNSLITPAQGQRIHAALASIQ